MVDISVNKHDASGLLHHNLKQFKSIVGNFKRYIWN